MNKKITTYMMIILSVFVIYADDNDREKETLDYFSRRGFVKTSYILLQNSTLRSLEKAQVISEICTRLFFYDERTDIDPVRLYELYEMVKKYRLQMTAVGLVEVDGALKKLKKINNQSGSLKRGYKFDNNTGIKASELEKRLYDSSDIYDKKIYPVGFGIKGKWYSSLKGLSYFQMNSTLYKPDTNLSYIQDDKLMFSAAFGYYHKDDKAFEFRNFYYKYYEERSYFGSAVSRYGTRVEPMMFSLKTDYFFGRMHKLYYGYGLTRMKTEHIAESGVREKAEDHYFCPHIYWGADVYSRKKYSLNFELLYFIGANGSMNVRGKEYSIDTDDLLIFFGMKFYFSDD